MLGLLGAVERRQESPNEKDGSNGGEHARQGERTATRRICDFDVFTRVDSFERVYVAPQGQRNLTGRKTDVAKSERTHVEALCAFTLLVYDVKEDRCRFWSHWLDRI